jgi:hypothetical protein
MERKIKTIGLKVDKGELFLEPNTLRIYENIGDNSICPTKFYIGDNNVLKNTNNNCLKKINNNDIKKFMLYPYTVLNSVELYKIYNITDIEDIEEKIKELIDEKYKFTTINRLLNSIIKSEFNNLKYKNNYLINIYTILFNYFFPDLKLNKIDIEIFINKWFQNSDSNKFNLNLGEDLLLSILK